MACRLQILVFFLALFGTVRAEECEDQEETQLLSIRTKLHSGKHGGLKQMPKYVAAQFIGFSIHTFPKDFGVAGSVPVYVGLDDIAADVEGRVELLKTALDAAYANKTWIDNKHVLKVFQVPEFYFRGPTGAYDANSIYGTLNPACQGNDQCSTPLATLGSKLSEMVQDPKWSDWLFVFGTVIAAENVTSSDGTVNQHTYNFAPVLKGGPDGQKFLVTKAYVSGIDFLNCREGQECVGNPHQEGKTYYSEVPQVAIDFLTEAGYTPVLDNVFQLDGLSVGIEICLDHLNKALLNNLAKKGLLAVPGTSGVDLHLVVSAGMSIKYNLGSTEFLQDGGTGATSQMVDADVLGSGTLTTYEPEQLAVIDSPIIQDLYAVREGDAVLNVFPPSCLPGMGQLCENLQSKASL